MKQEPVRVLKDIRHASEAPGVLSTIALGTVSRGLRCPRFLRNQTTLSRLVMYEGTSHNKASNIWMKLINHER